MVRVATGDTAGIERLGRYLLRSPVAVERLTFEPSTGEVLHHPKDAHDHESVVKHFDPMEFLARLLQHVPAPRLHQLRYFGRYSSVVRARRAASEAEETSVASAPDDSGAHGVAAQVEPDTAGRRRLRRLWASMIRRVYEVDPLICCECGGEMRVLAFILQSVAIRKILSHLKRQGRLASRGPPATSTGRVRAAS